MARTKNKGIKKTPKEEFPKGGYQIAPAACNKKIQLEKGGNYWVENVICVFYCGDQDCEGYQALMEGRKDRIAALMYHTMNKVCPHCSSERVSNEGSETIYACGTIGNKKTGTYDRHCGPKRKSRRTKRRNSD